MSEVACGHTKIKKINWYEDYGQSEKFMCLDCNTDFVPVTPDIRDFLFRKKWEDEVAKAHEPYGGLEKAHPSQKEPPPDTSWVQTEDIRKDNQKKSRHIGGPCMGVDCVCQ